MEEKKGKGFFASLFAPKSCCCNVQFEKIPAVDNEAEVDKEEDVAEKLQTGETATGDCGCSCNNDC